MTESEKKTKTPAGEWKAMVTMSFLPQANPIYVLKSGLRYMRLPTAPTARLGVWVADRRMATRLDSRIWAITISALLKGSRVVRLWTKSERERSEISSQTWAYDKAKSAAEPVAVTPKPAAPATDPKK